MVNPKSNNWYPDTYRRILLDFHIDDWHEDFLSRFDAHEFADCVSIARATAATVFANTHTGLCNYPTQVGRMHGGLKGRDALREMIESCHERDIDVVVYYCTIYVDWYWENHPAARIVDAEGKSNKLLMPSVPQARRFSVCCPNNAEYRQFVMDQLLEICSGYDFEGVWPDMTFWPTVCYCSACEHRYDREVGGQIPRIINWENPTWVRFQRKRQEWLCEFSHLVTSTIRSIKPEVTVAHQSHTFCRDWMMGPSVELAEETDWLSADLYGERYGLSFFAKLFYDLSEKKPFEHINTWCYPDIFEHVVTRTEEQLRQTAYSAFINHGAMVFIDAVDPLGSIHRRNYETVGKIYHELQEYEPFMGGQYCQDLGIYYSFESCFDLAENGKEVGWARYSFEPGRPEAASTAHRNAAMNLAKTLIQHHLPFGVITKKDLSRLSDFQIILLPNVVMLSEEEAAVFTAYVAAGGSLYASKNTSLIRCDGMRQADFLLSEILGVSYHGETHETVTYLTPVSQAKEVFDSFSSAYPATLYDSQLKVTAHKGTAVLATITLPYTDPKGTKYASILTDPPGIQTEFPALVRHRHGKGQTLYSAGVIESWEHDNLRELLVRLLEELANRPFWFQAETHKSVEITMFDQPNHGRYVLNLLNTQQELPNIPIRDIQIRVWMNGRKPAELRILPEGKSLPFRHKRGFIELTVPVLQDFVMIELKYR